MNPPTIGTITIIIKNRSTSAHRVNEILTEFRGIVIGRIGLPYPQRDLNIITLVVDSTTDQIGSLTGQLGQLTDVTVKSTLAKL